MVRAYHLILTAYGFWLPNDPRGSWSTHVWAENLRPFGEATKTSTRRSVASREHDHATRRQAKHHLRYPAVRFDGHQACAIARGFAQCVARRDLSVYACAVMPDHAHLILARHVLGVERIAADLKRFATRALNDEHRHPLAGQRDPRGRTPTPWAEGGWSVFLNQPADVRSRIEYVNANPIKAGLPPQHWRFVTPFTD
ncbi:MAG: hypothetical protein V3U29_03945 [Phycisphaeraceae bacterium]